MLSISIACVAVDIIDQLFNSKILDLGTYLIPVQCHLESFEVQPSGVFPVPRQITILVLRLEPKRVEGSVWL